MKDIKNHIRNLWELCFHEDKAFLDLYFEKRNIAENSIFIEKNGEIVSSMQLLPYQFTFCGKNVEMAYISGACTHPDWRGKGLMNELIINVFKLLQKRNIPIVSLIPANKHLFEYYAKTGFAVCFAYQKETVIHEMLSRSKSTDRTELYEIFAKIMSENDYCVQHSKEDFDVIMDDREMSGEPEENHREGDDFGMARIIDLETLLKIYAKNHQSFSAEFNVVDEILIDNTGFYVINKGEIYKTKISENFSNAITIPQITQALLGHKIEELPEILHGFDKKDSIMSLMLD